MKTGLFRTLVILGIAPVVATAEDFSWGNMTFQPRVYAGYANYELKSGMFNRTLFDKDGNVIWSGEQPLKIDLFGDSHDKFQISGLLFGVGGTLKSGRFFSDLYYQTILDQTAYSGFIEHRQTDDNITEDINYGDVSGQRQDWAISFGYMITDQWSVFAGYRSGNTKWDQTTNIYAYQEPYGQSKFDNNLSNRFEQDGPFLGTSYSLSIGPGLFTIKAAYTYLNGAYKYYENWIYYPPPYNGEGYESFRFESNLDGNSNAFLIGLSWMQWLTENLELSLEANYHRYKFDLSGTELIYFANDNLANTAQVNDGAVTEDLFTLTASLVYRF